MKKINVLTVVYWYEAGSSVVIVSVSVSVLVVVVVVVVVVLVVRLVLPTGNYHQSVRDAWICQIGWFSLHRHHLKCPSMIWASITRDLVNCIGEDDCPSQQQWKAQLVILY